MKELSLTFGVEEVASLLRKAKASSRRALSWGLIKKLH
jgi:hypothetical protein